jgi:poly(3-hydroxybutyrate) depolymerase
VDQAEVGTTWGKHCDDRGMILVLPRPRKDSDWDLGDLETIRKQLESIMRDYTIDANRIVVGGYQAGGSMALAYGFMNRERVRGIAVVDAAVPPRVQPRGNDPETRLEFFLQTFADSKLSPSQERQIGQLREMKFPLVHQKRAGPAAPPDAGTVELLLRWSDTLDRI